MFPSGNKKTFVSVLVLLLLQDIYFDSNFFFSRRFRYMLSSSLLLVIAFFSTFSLFFVSMFLSHYAVVNVRKSHATSGRFTALKRGQLD